MPFFQQEFCSSLMEIVRIRRWVEIYNIDFQRREKEKFYA